MKSTDLDMSPGVDDRMHGVDDLVDFLAGGAGSNSRVALPRVACPQDEVAATSVRRCNSGVRAVRRRNASAIRVPSGAANQMDMSSDTDSSSLTSPLQCGMFDLKRRFRLELDGETHSAVSLRSPTVCLLATGSSY